MRLVVLGASKGVGKATLKLGLERGHRMIAVSRTDEGMGATPNLNRYFFDVRDEARLRDTLKGADAVILSVGHPPTRKPVTLFSQGTNAVIGAMKAEGLRRLLVVTGIGAGDSRGHGGFFYDRILQPWLLRTIYEDKDRQEELVAQSGLDWTLVRPGFLTNGRARGKFRTLTDMRGQKAGRISRADVAAFLMACAEEPIYFGNTVNIFY
ncbi:MAG: NAD(P)H-binding protein [Alphaproteobacteria bacterium]|nr:NAD(P)H-binding protein [Alphaproteobacteria bacterium]